MSDTANYDVMEYDAATGEYRYRMYTDEERADAEQNAQRPVTPSGNA